MADANRSAEGYNPLCGDRLKVWVRLKDDVIEDVSFEGAGCAISKASASLMTTAVKGKRVAEAEAMFQLFHQMVTGNLEQPGTKALGKLTVFSGVAQFPTRVKCASLSWHALNSALTSDATEPASGAGRSPTDDSSRST
jgi:nitrogen fixation NifU-like protein